MSEVKRFTVFVHDVIEKDEGELVFFKDYAALKAERDALAAENIDLKHPGTYLPSKRETPATDAYISRLQAEGVEMFAENWESNCAHDDTFVGSKAKEFAANLRKENSND